MYLNICSKPKSLNSDSTATACKTQTTFGYYISSSSNVIWVKAFFFNEFCLHQFYFRLEYDSTRRSTADISAWFIRDLWRLCRIYPAQIGNAASDCCRMFAGQSLPHLGIYNQIETFLCLQKATAYTCLRLSLTRDLTDFKCKWHKFKTIYKKNVFFLHLPFHFLKGLFIFSLCDKFFLMNKYALRRQAWKT